MKILRLALHDPPMHLHEQIPVLNLEQNHLIHYSTYLQGGSSSHPHILLKARLRTSHPKQNPIQFFFLTERGPLSMQSGTM